MRKVEPHAAARSREGGRSGDSAGGGGGRGEREGADNADGEEPLHLPCWEGHLDVAQWLHSAGASLDATDSEGETPLHIACLQGHLSIAQWLLSAGASLDATSSDGYTPLHDTCIQGRLEIAKWLCSAGADATLKTNDGDTPAQLLQRHARSTAQLDQHALRSTLACLVRRAQAQGPLPSALLHRCSSFRWPTTDPAPALQVQRRRVLR